MMKKAIFIILIVISVVFINISGVNARVDAGGGTGSDACTYGVLCEYTFCGDLLGSGLNCDLNAEQVYARVAYRCYDGDATASSCKNFGAWKTVAYKNLASANAKSVKLNMNEKFNASTGGLAIACGNENTPGYENCVNNYVPTDFHAYFKFNGYQCPQLVISKSGSDYKGTYYNSKNGVSAGSVLTSGTRVSCISKDDYDIDVEGDIKSKAEEAVKEAAEEVLSENEEEKIDEGIIQSILDWAGLESSTRYELNEVDPCAIISGDIQQLLHTVFLFISVAGIIILIVMTIISVVKVITASEDNALSNFLKGLWKRIICLIILLLLPVIVTFLIQVVNGAGAIWGVNSDNPLCNITK